MWMDARIVTNFLLPLQCDKACGRLGALGRGVDGGCPSCVADIGPKPILSQ